MPANIRDIKGRIKAVGNIQRITRTMQMIATAHFQAMQRRATQAQAYTEKIAELVEELAGTLASSGTVNHPLLKAPDPAADRRLLLVITSNRGLCGAYNANVLRTSMQFLNDQSSPETEIEAVGKKAVSYFKFNHVPIEQVHTQFGDKPPYEEVERLAERFMSDYIAGKYDSVNVAYTAFRSMSKQEPVITRLLPLEDPSAKEETPTGPTAEYEFSPDPEQILAELLPVTVKTRLFQCFNEAVVSEQLAHMVAMKGATDAAGRMKRDLNRKYNRARQAAITTELTEIIGGAAALE